MPSNTFSFHTNVSTWHEDAQPGVRDDVDVEWQIRQALYHGDRERARVLYFHYMIPDNAFSDMDVERIGYQVGAVDLGDRYLASRSDL